jgi:hypothetical protein
MPCRLFSTRRSRGANAKYDGLMRIACCRDEVVIVNGVNLGTYGRSTREEAKRVQVNHDPREGLQRCSFGLGRSVRYRSIMQRRLPAAHAYIALIEMSSANWTIGGMRPY